MSRSSYGFSFSSALIRVSTNYSLPASVSTHKRFNCHVVQSRKPIKMALAGQKKARQSISDKDKSMTLHFISKDVAVDGRAPNELKKHIESLLGEEGDAVRWAIVEADEENGTVRVEAVLSRFE